MIPAMLREAVAAARSQAVPSLLTVAMVAGMCIAALLTTGRTVAAEQAVLAEVDAAGTRSIVVRAREEAGLTVALRDRLTTVDGVEAATGFGPIVDARNAAVPGAPPVALRHAYGLADASSTTDLAATSETAAASAAAARAVGFYHGTGVLATDDGHEVLVTGDMTVPPHLRFLEPLLVIPSGEADPAEPLTLLVVLARTPPEVAAVEEVVRGLLPTTAPGEITVETSAELAAVRAAVGGELGSHGRSTVLGILALSSILVAVNLLALVTMRRKDFGRRRALGATKPLIVTLLLTQVVLLASAGAAIGAAATITGLALAGDPLPGLPFTVAVAVAAVLAAALAALAPAMLAARRDPLHELRVP